MIQPPKFRSPSVRLQVYQRIHALVVSLRKIAGDNVTVDERPEGTVINAPGITTGGGIGPPPPPTFVFGGCCHGFSCSFLTLNQCVSTGGVYLGDNTTCTPNNCGTFGGGVGSCCHPDGSCTATTMDDCDDLFTGGGTCVPNLCPPPSGAGACCIFPHDCAITPSGECTGVYYGDGSTCEGIDCIHSVYCPPPNTWCPCPPAPPEFVTPPPNCCDTANPICATCWNVIGQFHYCCCCHDNPPFGLVCTE